jgi:copper chaperone CopZ
MKKAIPLLIVLVALFWSCTQDSKTTVEKSVKVWGNCEKCKTRIESACKVQGVTDQSWNIESKLLTFKVDTAVLSVNYVLKQVARAGHDNEAYFADDYAYSKLPETCQYERRLE